MTLLEYPDKELMLMALADALAGELRTALASHEAVSFCVPGGTTPGPVFDVLAAVQLDWARVTVLMTDERWVPPDHPRSNAQLVRTRLLTGAAAAARFLPFHRPGLTPAEAAPLLSEEVAALLPVSVLLLGMGEDMHTASLFPGAAGLAEALAPEAPAVVAVDAPGAPEPRVSLSAPALAGALSIHLAITGAAKRAALERARSLPPEDAPVRAILTTASVHWAP